MPELFYSFRIISKSENAVVASIPRLLPFPSTRWNSDLFFSPPPCSLDSLDELFREKKKKTRAQIITKKNINVNEELLLDYGDDYWRCLRISYGDYRIWKERRRIGFTQKGQGDGSEEDLVASGQAPDGEIRPQMPPYDLEYVPWDDKASKTLAMRELSSPKVILFLPLVVVLFSCSARFAEAIFFGFFFFLLFFFFFFLVGGCRGGTVKGTRSAAAEFRLWAFVAIHLFKCSQQKGSESKFFFRPLAR
jgi:hypothetical protein